MYAAVNGADVINISWGGTGFSITAQNVMTWAYSQGCLLVAGAGNNGNSTMFYPAAYANVIAVASTDNSDIKSSTSNYGSWVDVSAPGHNIYSTTISNSYGIKTGTSMASPLVAGLCGLMKSLNPSLTQTDIINCLKNNTANINALNPGYSGLLGTGRINASAAMQCVSASLNWAPLANFTSNVTNVTAGGVVSFTDHSVYNPTSWSWTFAGGSPGIYNGKTPPPITYNTPGVYTVTLVASNSNGSDNEIKIGYIDVDPGGGCAHINYPRPSAWALANYVTGPGGSGSDGFINGVNAYGDKQKAMYYDASSTPYTYITGVNTAFGEAYSSNANKVVTLRVFDGTSGSPGSQLTSIATTMGKIMIDENANRYTSLIFPNPVLLPASKKFFVSIDMTNLSWSGNPKDTLAIISNTNGQTVPSAVWEQQSDNSWQQYTTGDAWNLNISLLIHPIITDEPAIATYTQTATSICQGSSVSFNAAGSTYDDTLLWVFSGGNPSISSNVQQSVIYNTPGTYNVKLYVIGGGCSQLDSMVTTIVVKPNPVVSVSSTNNIICLSGSSTLSASGASTYGWSPSTGLSSTSGPSVIASPSVTTTYNVVATGANGCSSNSGISITVEGIPVVTVLPVSSSICIGDTIFFDASTSTNVSSFTWSCPGATPAFTTSPIVAAKYISAGTFIANLHASNSCFADSSYSNTIMVGCVNIEKLESDRNLQVIYDPVTRNLKISAISLGKATVVIVNSLGEVVASHQPSGIVGLSSVEHNFALMPPGIYFVGWMEQDFLVAKKIVVY